jgi:DNA polymerase-3 subunit delta'
MIINPSENTMLYGMNSYFHEIAELYNKGKMPNKVLLAGKKGIGKSTLAYHIINYVLSQNEDKKYDLKNLRINNENRSYKLLQNKSHQNFYLIDLIDEKKNIDIAQIRELITYTNKSSFNKLPRFILIDNIENLNKNSTNALLKIVEEPNDNIFFILIHNNEKSILPTLKSRCLTFKINFSFTETINITNRIIKNNLFDLINFELISYYNTPGDFIALINLSTEKKINLKECSLVEFLNLLIDSGYYKKNKSVKQLINNFIELFFLKEYKQTLDKNSLINMYHVFLNKINDTEKFNLDEESIFLEFKSKLLNV